MSPYTTPTAARVSGSNWGACGVELELAFIRAIGGWRVKRADAPSPATPLPSAGKRGFYAACYKYRQYR